MRVVSFVALIVGVILIPTALGVAKMDHDRDADQVERMLVAETDEHGGAPDNYLARARSVVLLTANSPAFANVLAEPGTRADKARRGGRDIAEVTHHLGYLEQLYPSSIPAGGSRAWARLPSRCCLWRSSSSRWPACHCAPRAASSKRRRRPTR